MQAELRILLEQKFISRKQYRELLKDTPTRLDILKSRLISSGSLDLPDWQEALVFLEKSQPENHSASDRPPEDSKFEKAPESKNSHMHEIQQTAMRVALSDTTILLLGESGVGKSRLARLVHEHSARRNGPLITVACGSIPDTLLESELFGVERGAYTGANKSREGRFQRAQGGSIFLDEIGELSPQLQVKLLRVLQERKVEPLGSSAEIDVDVRMIVATNRNLEADVKSGRFREDLYFRLNVIPLTLPPLRLRPQDIQPLADFFLNRFSREMGIKFQIDDSRVYEIISKYSWPGNIRELENCMERLSVLVDVSGLILIEYFPARILSECGYQTRSESKQGRQTIGKTAKSRPDLAGGAFASLKEVERQHIQRALESSQGNLKEAAILLGIHRNTLSRKLQEFNLQSSSYKIRPGN